jgi:predicted Zn finger-like uncharacterized protein
MKFLCGSCKAKYQIADEKIAGRTLRMKCRRCSHDIVLRGSELPGSNAPASRGAPAAASASRRRGPAPAPAPQQKPARRQAGSALGADFRREVASAPQSPTERVSPLDQWHVAINDVPVGPIKRDEIARKVIAGAVNGDSLCWREGFDDWRPLREVPELAAVLQKRPAPPRPPAPAAGALRGGSGARSRPRAASTSRSGSSSFPSRPADASRPAARSNVVPIGGRLGAAAAPAFEQPETDFDDLEGEPTRVSDPLVLSPEEQSRESQRPLGAPAPATVHGDPFGRAPAAAPPADPFGGVPATSLPEHAIHSVRPARRGLPVGAWIAIAGAGAFGMMLAAMVGTKLLSDDEAPAAAAVNPQTAQPEQPTPELVVPDEIEEPAEGEAEAETAEEREAGGRPRTGGTPRTGSTGSTKTKQLTAEERALLERFGSETGAAPAKIRVSDDQAGQQRRGQVDAAALNAVVSRNRPALRRCYEIAIRGMGDPPSIRVNVRVTIGGSGGVTNVAATANGETLSGLGNCVESTVRRWRFPASGETMVTEFPVVFAPGG